MKAITRHVYGQADALSYEEIDRPTVGADEVMVRIEAAGVDRGVWHLITGLPYPVRLAGYGVRAPKNPVIGMDLAGAVEAVGRNVTTFAPGDRVYGNADGSFAEYATTSADRLARMPANLSFEQAAVVPVSAVAALQGLRKGNVEAGQRLLIIGASGGVGTYAVQIAKAWGAEVTGVCSTSKVHHVKAIGADHVIDYTQQKIASRGEQYDVIIDIGGNRTLTELRRALTPEGTLVIAGGETDGRWLGG
ncbi:MAG: NAD(P)-dependent alcohol dehydrogenase, partial [Candidatus Nanopelagicales bacterium]